MKTEEDRIKVCLQYKDYLIKRIKSDSNFKEQVINLHNKNIYCFCSNGTNSLNKGAKYCHGHVLLACSERLYKEKYKYEK